MPPKVHKNLCKGCGMCIEECGVHCFTFNADTYQAVLSNGRECVDCFICELVCPEHAITMTVKPQK